MTMQDFDLDRVRGGGKVVTGIEKIDFEGVGVVAERGIGGKERDEVL